MTRLSQRSALRRGAEESVNPMDSVSNLADAMLVLAVGIMLALIVNWNVDISLPQQNEQQPTDPIPFEETDLTEAPDGSAVLDGGNLQEMGKVYYDAESGNYYIIKDGN